MNPLNQDTWVIDRILDLIKSYACIVFEVLKDLEISIVFFSQRAWQFLCLIWIKTVCHVQVCSKANLPEEIGPRFKFQFLWCYRAPVALSLQLCVYAPRPGLPHTTLKCHIFCVKSGRVHNSESTKSYLLMAFHSGLHRYCPHPSDRKQDSKYHRRNVIGCKTWTIFLKWVYRGLIISLFIAVTTKDIWAGFILRCCDTNQILGLLIHLYEEVRDELNIVGALSRSR